MRNPKFDWWNVITYTTLVVALVVAINSQREVNRIEKIVQPIERVIPHKNGTARVLKGERGPRGPSGPQGPRGKSGPAGPRGATGPAGPAGASGSRGPRGHRGFTGAQGDRGPQGERGLPGIRGPSGLTPSQPAPTPEELITQICLQLRPGTCKK